MYRFITRDQSIMLIFLPIMLRMLKIMLIMFNIYYTIATHACDEGQHETSGYKGSYCIIMTLCQDIVPVKNLVFVHMRVISHVQ